MGGDDKKGVQLFQKLGFGIAEVLSSNPGASGLALQSNSFTRIIVLDIESVEQSEECESVPGYAVHATGNTYYCVTVLPQGHHIAELETQYFVSNHFIVSYGVK